MPVIDIHSDFWSDDFFKLINKPIKVIDYNIMTVRTSSGKIKEEKCYVNEFGQNIPSSWVTEINPEFSIKHFKMFNNLTSKEKKKRERKAIKINENTKDLFNFLDNYRHNIEYPSGPYSYNGYTSFINTLNDWTPSSTWSGRTDA